MASKIKSKKPGMNLLTTKERSSLAKRAVAGKDIGKPGKMFSRVEESASVKYGSKEIGKKVAAAAMIKARAAKKK
jgi:hypothetical protein